MEDSETIIIAISNHKGGCGKTTTVVNLASEFSRMGASVLVVDLDPQANASLHLGTKHPSEISVTCAELLTSPLERLPQAIYEDTCFKGVSLIYGSLTLGKTEDELKEDSPRPLEELQRKLNPLKGIYDIVLIDCPPSLKILTSNALAAATHYIIPIESGSQYGMYGVSDLLKHVEKIKRVNPKLRLLGGLLMRHDERQTVCKLLEHTAKEQLGMLFPMKISSSTKVNQAAIAKVSISDIDKSSKLAREFRQLADYIIDMTGLNQKFKRVVRSSITKIMPSKDCKIEKYTQEI